ncbi:MAG: U32 family peptidase, partial [Clostridiales bacterium]|nr:U32 family peptidase [Clostridiales bacterium]
MTKMEILAPAGGTEQLVAAVRCGADAVYLGTSGFNARQNARNFGEVQLAEAIEYCAQRNVQVHVTLNTLIFDNEISELKKHIKQVAECGANAIIAQDLATARLVRECCPDMPLHASTQMTVHNSLGVEAARELGFSRVVLARELTLDEISSIAKNTDIEIETFIHGALCTCVSGACYLSAMLGGRSGNRGRCAQPCRLNFTNRHGREYALSLKDMSYVKSLPKLMEAGVASLKIEGRMKRPEYVAAAVTAVKSALDGREPDMKQLESIFSRDGFTDGYLTGKRNVYMYGRRKKEDAQASQSVMGELASLYRAERQSVNVGAEISVRENKPVTLTVNDGINFVTVESVPPQKAINRSTTSEDIYKAISKTGGTPFFLEGLRAHLDDGLAVSGSTLNALRRDALEKLLELRKPVPKSFNDVPIEIKKHTPAAKKEVRLRFEDFSFVSKNKCRFDKLIIPVKEILSNSGIANKYKDKLIAELPALVWENDVNSLEQDIESLMKMGITDVICANIGTAHIALAHGSTVHGDMGLNVLNSVSLEEYKALGVADMTVSFEARAAKIK